MKEREIKYSVQRFWPMQGNWIQSYFTESLKEASEYLEYFQKKEPTMKYRLVEEITERKVIKP